MPDISKQRKAQLEAATKEKVALAVFRIFEKHHPKKLTIDMVARKSGMSKGALYKHFRNKDDIVTFAILHALDPYLQKNLSIANGSLPVIDKLRASAEVSLTCTEEMLDFLHFMIQSASIYSIQTIKAMNERRFQNWSRIEGIMGQGLRQGVLDGADERNLTLYFAGVVRFAYLLRSKLPKELRRSFAEDADKIVERFLCGVTRRKPDAEV